QAVAYDIKVNNTDIYLTGYIEYPYMKQLFLGKFDSVGTNVWAETLGGPGTEDIGKGLVVTGEDVYVVGQTESLANYLTDTITLKYNSTGHMQWYRLRDEEEGNSIALRPDGNILIAGDIGYSDGLFAVEYSPTGFLRWNTIWSSGGLDNCMGIVAGQVNFYLVGQSNSFGSGDFDMLLITFQSVVTVTPPPETVTVPGDTDVNITLNLIGQALLWTGFALLLLILILLIIFFVLCMIRSGERVVTKTKKEKPKTIVKEVPVTVYKDRVITKEGPPGPEKKPEDDPLTLESDIDDAPEVGPATHRQFKKLKIKKVKDFMSQTPEEIVEQLNKNGYTRLKVEDIKRMQTEAQLMLDIGPLRVHDAVILFKVGIKSRSALAKSDQDELWEKVQGVVDDTHVRKFLRWSNLEPTYEEMADWIAFGKEALKSTD
ncbi:MAG: DUF4332 domain-containing protein, partial [Asgard group archaeon]|nr:DUF4332 domain-containing protein [Asgard group archaeon]